MPRWLVLVNGYTEVQVAQKPVVCPLAVARCGELDAFLKVLCLNSIVPMQSTVIALNKVITAEH